MLGRLVEWLRSRVDYYVIREDESVSPGYMSDPRAWGVSVTLIPRRAERFGCADEARFFAAVRGVPQRHWQLVAVHKDGRESVAPW